MSFTSLDILPVAPGTARAFDQYDDMGVRNEGGWSKKEVNTTEPRASRGTLRSATGVFKGRESGAVVCNHSAGYGSWDSQCDLRPSSSTEWLVSCAVWFR
ncbi:unnamed protein product [Pleuronectes platessa]|uniref:Uncharacterized protein n=1 Tax=Pleuronectes platessa TaxID=8262 RepID=A0A9N7VN72_PLEPL|nr:unnamed protein product [Pleuronectes platessa]